MTEADTSRPTTMFLGPRRSLRGWGVAAIIDVPAPWVDHVQAVTAALDQLGRGATSVTHSGEQLRTGPATGPIAFGALPFDRSAAARFVVPQFISVETAEGDLWSTTIENPRPQLEVEVENPTIAEVRRVAIHAPIPAADWCETVRRATDRIASGRIDKVVLARELVIEADTAFDSHELAARLADLHPHAMRFDIDGFIGASPELLVSRFDDLVRSHPMAGTTPRTGDAQDDAARAAELLASSKNREEHQITIDMVLDTLLDVTSFVDAEPVPSVVDAGSVQHLATLVEGRLSDPPASVLELVAALHPTPAVGGFPRDAALDLIGELEPGDRGRYAGPVGWVDADGNGAFAVGLRSASIDGATARLFAGVGVVEDSDPISELDETRSKFAATLGIFTRF